MAKNTQAETTIESRSKRILREILPELDAGRETEAIRHFMQGIHQGLFPGEGELLKWLIQTLGKEHFSRLINAFVRHPCFYCKEGRDVCRECKGKRQLEGHTICTWCLGLGVTRCDFCDGSGWVTINYVPPPLRFAVVVQRGTLARERMSQLLKEPLPELSRQNAGKILNQYGHLLLELDKAMGSFENVIVAAGGFANLDASAGKVLAKVIDFGIRLSGQGRDRIQKILHAMSTLSGYQAEDLKKPAIRDLALNAAKFYDREFREEDLLAGTNMEHPFLHKAMEKRAGKERKASG